MKLHTGQQADTRGRGKRSGMQISGSSLFLLVVLLCCLPHGGASAFVVITEIHYHPRNNENALEFVELLNDSPTTEDLTGWKFVSGIEYTFPRGTTIPPHGYLVVCADPQAIRRGYQIENVAGPFSGELNNKGAVLELRNAADVRVDWVDYADEEPWPAGADGTGHTLALMDPLSDNERGVAWALSEQAGGTPGRSNFAANPPPPDIVINEVFLDTKGEKWIELHNLTTATRTLSGYALSDEADTLRKFVVPKGTLLGPRGFVAFAEKQLKFKLSPKQRKIFLSTPQGRVCDAVACRKVPAEYSVGRWPDGATVWFCMKQPTAGRPNTVARNRDVIINEIMYHPFSDREDDEYVELYNRGTEAADLGGWAFTKGIEFTFAPGTILPPDSYLVIAKNRRALAAKYGIANCIGDYRKQLNNDGDHLILRDSDGNIADEVRFYDGGRWPKWADGGGSSLELIDPRQDNDCPTAWADSDETSKSKWTRVTYTKSNNNGRAEFQMFLLEAGVVLVDDLELRDGNRNYLPNGGFDSDAKGWEFGGTHKYATRIADLESTGGCLRIEAVGGGTTGVNSVRATLLAPLLSTGTYTVSYRARWLAGNPWLCTRVHNNGVAQTNAIPVPEALGTPGRRNSRYAENTGPIIWDLAHSPVVPTSATPVTVTARIADPDGVTSATVHYRLDGAPAGVIIPIWDDGCHGDGAAGDGLYGAVLPPQGPGQLVEYYVQAMDGRGALRDFPPEGPRAAAIYRVRNDGPPRPTAMKQFDLLIATGTLRQLYARSGGSARMDNEFLNATLVVNGQRVFQNIGVRYQGSPYLRPARGGLFGALFVKQQPGYVVRFNDDEKLLGYRRLNFDSQNVDRTGLHERMVAWLASRFGGIPCNAREYVKLSLNGGPPAIVELLQRIDKRFLEDAFPGAADGDLYETNTAFEWRGSQFTARAPEFRDRGPDKELYRHTFQKRTNEAADDFTSLMELLRALDPQKTDDARLETVLEAVLDVDQWLRTLAVMAVVGDWDGVGFMTNKNGYLYRRPDTGRWVLIPWDKDLTWERAQMQVVNPRLVGISRLMTYPPLKRRYYRCIEELLEGPFARSEIDPVVDSLHQMLLAEGGEFSSPTAMKRFVDVRRKWLQENVVPTTVTFSIATGGGKDFATSASTVALEGSAPLCVKTLTLNGKPVAVEWSDATRWRLAAVPLAKGENRFELTASPMPPTRESKCAIIIRRE